MSEVRQVPVEQIDDPLIPMREQFGDALFDELVEDIGKNGVTVPLKLRVTGERFRVVFGHRRLKAAQVCALREVPAIVEEMDDFAEVRQMISENTGREEVSAAEQGRYYLSMSEFPLCSVIRKSLTPTAMAWCVGRSPSSCCASTRTRGRWLFAVTCRHAMSRCAQRSTRIGNFSSTCAFGVALRVRWRRATWTSGRIRCSLSMRICRAETVTGPLHRQRRKLRGVSCVAAIPIPATWST